MLLVTITITICVPVTIRALIIAKNKPSSSRYALSPPYFAICPIIFVTSRR